VIDEFAKEYLHDALQWARDDLLAQLDGLSEYDVRRPMTRSSTNLLGLVKHLTLSEARYFGPIFDRSAPVPLPDYDDPDYVARDHMWARPDESRMAIVEGYRQIWAHADATIDALPIDAPGYVPRWPRPNVKLFNIMVHLVSETNRHNGHADILREELLAQHAQDDDAMWLEHRAKVERAAQELG